MRRLALWFCVAFSLVLLSGCSLPRAYESALVLADAVAGEAPSRLKTRTPEPKRVAITYAIENRDRRADLYTPATGAPRAGIVLVPGVVPEGKDNPELAAFARTLARVGFAVLVPDMPGFARLRIHPDDTDLVADAFRYLAGRPDLAPGGRAGLGAFSYGVGPAVLAALEPDVRERVRFILGVGGYYDLERALRFLTTGWFEHEGRLQALDPHSYGQMVLVRSAQPYLTSERDRALLEAMVKRRLADRQAPLTDLAEALSSEGRAVHDLATNRDYERFPDLLARLPVAMRRDLAALNLAQHDLRAIKAHFILVHGRNDPLIPYPESLALARAVGEEGARVFLIHRILGHVDLSLGHALTRTFWSEELPDVWRMGRAVYALLSERGDE